MKSEGMTSAGTSAGVICAWSKVPMIPPEERPHSSALAATLHGEHAHYFYVSSAIAARVF